MEETRTLRETSILFLGAGSIAEAILRGLVQRQAASPGLITVTNRSNREKLEKLARTYEVQTEQDPDRVRRLASQAEVIVLAMKPADAPAALMAYRGLFSDKQLIVSVIAGLSIGTIRELLDNEQLPVSRTIPNTSSSIGLGMTGIAFSEDMPEEMRQLTLEMFHAVGETELIREEEMHILTGISGSGPAYLYYFAEALISGGVLGGFQPDQARALAVNTLLGAAAMIRDTGEDPANLRRKVTSPNGTTQAAIETLERYAFKEAVEQAVLRCTARSREIADMIDTNAQAVLRDR
ncbi:pyrroline-5-carboxylate reductase [Gorillibacterium sp. sgz500922]|uniref:pyrroline-5-carboxylate reductase n=1 Tax=Gorillibacterium sp. sgz500922 TaxID=3446694 RepID=UPI003F67E5B8